MATSDEIALWRTQLAEAEAALHSIVVNGSVARVRHGDKSMEWNAQNVGRSAPISLNCAAGSACRVVAPPGG